MSSTLPKRLARLGRARVLRRVEKACRSIAELVRDTASDLLLRSESELVFVESARADHVLGGNVGVSGKSLQHDSLRVVVVSRQRRGVLDYLPSVPGNELSGMTSMDA